MRGPAGIRLDARAPVAYKLPFRIPAPQPPGRAEEVETMPSQQEIIEATNRYLIPNYGRLPIAMVRGAGARIWDAAGAEYIDLFAGFGAAGAVGHCHPAVTAAVRAQAEMLTTAGNLFTNAPQVALARTVTEKAFGGKVFYCHSGAEANEAAIKLARLAAGEGRYKLISFHGCFHGRTMGALSLTPEKFQKGFGPMLPGNVQVDYGDIDATASAVDDETAGIIVEPIQGEGGVNMPPAGFMQALRGLCDEKDLVLICDEVWTAPARTGRWFAYQHYGIVPDIMTLGKAVGGGLPVGIMAASPKYADLLGPGTHGCTMGGQPLCAAAAAATMKVIETEDLVARAAEKGRGITKALRDASIPKVRQVRGAGMMIGIQLDCPGKGILNACLEKGVIINYTNETVLRLAPPLTIEDDLLEKGLRILIDVLKG